MRVKADLTDVSIELGTSGLTLNVSESGGGHRGDLRIGKATVEWMPGKTRTGNGHKIPLSKLLDLIEEHVPRKA